MPQASWEHGNDGRSMGNDGRTRMSTITNTTAGESARLLLPEDFPVDFPAHFKDRSDWHLVPPFIHLAVSGRLSQVNPKSDHQTRKPAARDIESGSAERLIEACALDSVALTFALLFQQLREHLAMLISCSAA